MEDVIAETEAAIEALKLRLPELEGKANKKERSQVNKEIYNLENDDAYVTALKSRREIETSASAAAADEAHREKLQAEHEFAEQRRVELAKKQEERTIAAASETVDDGEVHMAMETLTKGDGRTYPKRGDSVGVTYVGVFADSTEHGGVHYGGAQFDSTFDAKRKEDKPLSFQLGAGKVIRGWEECLLKMSLGESVKLTVFPKWAYRKAGVQDDDGKVVVPPNATLIFNMTLALVNGNRQKATK
uniref:peptidylprolyl isomerase n=1 Tax=Calcidiscus leptoporus TaxID=127549 RepID=A0A7S0JJP9_9EUKA|mmetsp:Transcript_77/g.158  ORF Transcript_77/g.158 Transcript_77/m.158 type:complete len:244 (+) Transcript_77:27-758(+)|eukprot:CAMPEP_0119368570 /NCGR_PEP_ID=MMETSP1334-20130426/15202_1 /TAXON_ID=127549 /ORGANISM="Calcidiscus leptoporus, Strain RCC1130" /LENGTH=243 /DNA_ID=CAMNT_0007385237 /DNA_START=27 /DNA_END=758 /DNA_ORIENTATION=-